MAVLRLIRIRGIVALCWLDGKGGDSMALHSKERGSGLLLWWLDGNEEGAPLNCGA